MIIRTRQSIAPKRVAEFNRMGNPSLMLGNTRTADQDCGITLEPPNGDWFSADIAKAIGATIQTIQGCFNPRQTVFIPNGIGRTRSLLTKLIHDYRAMDHRPKGCKK
jgi:hypothetical protein